MPVTKLMNNEDLLNRIQKCFKMKCKGELNLKNYALIGKDLEKYSKMQEEYQLNVFEMSWQFQIINQFEKAQSEI